MSCLLHIEHDDLHLYERLGLGTYGSVHRAHWISRGFEVAVKKLLTLGEEAEILSQISHRNVVQFFGVVLSHTHHWIVMEYAPLGSLYDFLRRNPAQIDLDLPHASDMLPSFKQILKWSHEIALGMNYLHCEAPVKVIHRDLKSKNVVISSDLVCKICDFGSSRFAGSTTRMSLAGTYPWMSPEVIQSLPVNEKCDSWSYGVVLWEIITREVPFDGMTGFQVQWLVVEKGERLVIPKSCPERFASLMKSCWSTNPPPRPSFKQILDMVDSMISDKDLARDTQTFLSDKPVWSKEISDAMEKLKEVEFKLGEKEKALKQREKYIQRREKALEKQFQVVQLDLYNVLTWREVDVAQWIGSFDPNNATLVNEVSTGLAAYAPLFAQHHITGRLLMELTSDDLKNMGLKSLGHITQFMDHIVKLRAQNQINQHFPPLDQKVGSTKAAFAPIASTRPFTMAEATCRICLTFGVHMKPSKTLEDKKWMPYILFEEESDSSTPLNPQDSFKEELDIKEVLVRTTVSTQYISVHLDKSPFTARGWTVGVSPGEVLHAIVTFCSERVSKPESLTLEYVLDPSQTSPTEQTISITLRRLKSSCPSAVNSVIETSSISGTSSPLNQSVHEAIIQPQTVSSQSAFPPYIPVHPSPSANSLLHSSSRSSIFETSSRSSACGSISDSILTKSWATVVQSPPKCPEPEIVDIAQISKEISTIKKVVKSPVHTSARPTLVIPSYSPNLQSHWKNIDQSQRRTSSPFEPKTPCSDSIRRPRSAQYGSSGASCGTSRRAVRSSGYFSASPVTPGSASPITGSGSNFYRDRSNTGETGRCSGPNYQPKSADSHPERNLCYQQNYKKDRHHSGLDRYRSCGSNSSTPKSPLVQEKTSPRAHFYLDSIEPKKSTVSSSSNSSYSSHKTTVSSKSASQADYNKGRVGSGRGAQERKTAGKCNGNM